MDTSLIDLFTNCVRGSFRKTFNAKYLLIELSRSTNHNELHVNQYFVLFYMVFPFRFGAVVVTVVHSRK